MNSSPNRQDQCEGIRLNRPSNEQRPGLTLNSSQETWPTEAHPYCIPSMSITETEILHCINANPLSQLGEDEYYHQEQEIDVYLSELSSYHATKPLSSYFAH